MWPYYVESLDDSLERLIRDTASAYGLRLTKPVMRTLTNAVWDVCGDHPVDAAGAAALKAQHEAGRVMLLASNTCRPGAHRRRTLADAGLGFMHVICSSDVGVAKPDLGFYQWIIEESGVRPEEILFVGDNVLNDVARPKKAGMQAAWVRKSTPSNDSPARLPDGTWLLSSLSQLAEILP